MPLAWVVFGGATSPKASLAIWMAFASNIILQCCLHGQQKPSFCRVISAPFPSKHKEHTQVIRMVSQEVLRHCILTPECPAVCRAASEEGLESQQGMCRAGMSCQRHAWQHTNQSSAFSSAVGCYQLHASLEWKERWIFQRIYQAKRSVGISQFHLAAPA